MAPDNESTNHDVIIMRLDRQDADLKEIKADQKDTNSKVSDMCKDFAVFKAKIYAVVTVVTVLISATWQYATNRFK